ncbi:p-hydroxyphenylacetate 3-hydroxylase reductase component [Pseudomonas sp. NW5]|uniref:p-hydroxyphenylacetate 3-hydroxylase reductase component n=1 Tax=Pseudomonas sp. NW5 TaxID=2934934 RepID=UPI00202082CB|nr:flavin reductase [Pseudomonas sp. NW5]MCL7462409.1 flavin reductase [Pseudomonas sp. NW5]
MTTRTFDAHDFRRALGNFATGITIITARGADGELTGVTANSFNSVSLDPPLILWSLDKRSSSNVVFEQASHFAVNILAAEQIDLSNHFARSHPDKFAGIAHDSGLGGAPLLPGCAARLQCESFQRLDGGDHWILVGKVVDFDDQGRDPLLYHRGAYSLLMPHPQTPRHHAADPSKGESRLDSHLLYLMLQAVNAYQTSYGPRQQASGLETSEARVLMVLDENPGLDLAGLQHEAAMPASEIEEAMTSLAQRGLLERSPGHCALTAPGQQQVEQLWAIVHAQEEAVFAGIERSDLEIFKRVLRQVIAAH